jgi:hypothetical protein
LVHLYRRYVMTESYLWSTALIIIAAVPFVCLRMYTRWAKFGGLAIEDGLIILALLCLVGDLAIQQHMWNLGLGDMSTVNPENFKGIMQMIVPGSILYVASLWAVKFALVLFYKRLAAPGSRLITIYNVALGGLVVTFLIIFFDILFQCFPYDKRWSQDPNCAWRAFFLKGSKLIPTRPVQCCSSSSQLLDNDFM